LIDNLFDGIIYVSVAVDRKLMERRCFLKKILKITSVFLVAVALLTIVATPVSAATTSSSKRELGYFLGINDKRVTSYREISVSVGGKMLKERGRLINETTYVPLRSASEISGATVIFDARNRTATVILDSLQLTVTDGSYIAEANGRILLSKTPSVILDDGRMYIPVRTLAKALSLEVVWTPPSSVRLEGTPRGLVSAEDYYRSDDLYWLARIINAESRGEPLLGQIAVGNVVLNRKRSKDYPNTVYGVIFDRKYGVQFSPILDGSIYMTPTYSAILAAKICLEGVSVSDKILFFMAPDKAVSSWIINNRQYAFTVENHYFFY
jgi:N-acetylmuramoyl-L-alanine amidase